MRSRYYLAVALAAVVACDDLHRPWLQPVDEGGSHAGELDASVAPSLDASQTSADAMMDRDAQILRGQYLTNVIYPCGSCHTPRNGADKVFSGVDCWTDTLPNDSDAGCLSSRNLTNHPTGIGNLTDTDVKNAFLHGIDADGKALFSQMPYSLLGNMREQDADAIVAYLRSLPPIDHRVLVNQPPFDVPPATPAPLWPEAQIPMPRADYPDRAAALRGRYLAGNFGGCMDCHTPRDSSGAQLRDQAFSGGRAFGPTTVSPNLTPDPTGIASDSIDDIVGAIKRGRDPNQGYSMLCPPMPFGPMGAYGGMTDDDAQDIAHYLFSIAPVHNVITVDCEPDAGT